MDHKKIGERSQYVSGEDALQRTRENYTELVELTNSVILRWNVKGEVTFLNRFGQTFFGYSADEIMGRNVVGTIVPETDQAGHDLIRMIRDIGTHPELYVKNQNENMRKNGERVWISWTNKATFDEIGNVMEILSVGNDHTDIKRTEEELRRSKEELETKVAERTAKLLGVNERLNAELEERQRIQESLRESEQRHKSLYLMMRLMCDNAPDLIWAKDLERRFLFVNRATSEKLLMANDCEEPIGKGDMFFVEREREKHPDDPNWHTFGEICIDSDAVVMNTQTSARFDEFGNVKGEFLYLDVYKAPFLNEQGEMIGTVGCGRDVTMERTLAEALRVNEERYRLVVEKAREGIMVTQEGLIRFVNPAIGQIMKYTPEELVSHQFIQYIHPNDRDMVLQRHLRRLKGEDFENRYSFRIITRDGETRWIEIDVGLITWEDSPASVVLMTDITERKQREEELVESEEWYRSLVENSFDGIFVQKGPKIIFANPRFHEMLGYDHGELDGMDHWLVYHKDYQVSARRHAIERMRGEKNPPQDEVKLRRKDGASFFCETSARKITVKGETGVEVWVRDISKRMKAEAVQRRLATAVDQAAEAIVITDTRGNILYANPSFERITGYSREEAIGKTPRILSSGRHDRSFYRDLWQTIIKGNSWSGCFVNKKKDGTLYHEDATISPVRDSFGKIVNYVAVKKDVTLEMTLQKQLVQAQKMEAIGTLAGGIAHDFNNLLQVILGTTEVLLWGKSEAEPDRANLQKVYDAGKRGDDLVRSLLTFSRQQPTKLRAVDLNEETVNVSKLLTSTIPKTIKIDLRLSGALDTIYADPTQVAQVLMNLAVNARDAMPDGGVLTIESANVQLDEKYCNTNPEVKPGRYVSLTVSDNGCGMDRKTLDNIFHPFFTTKEVGKGTGLGLATVYGIVMRHHGHIEHSSELGHGTTFKIYFPVVDKEEDTEPTKGVANIRGGKETILLVEDEEIVRDLAASLLMDFGYEVITATNGKEALKIYQRHRERIALVILDFLMPEMDGRQCLNQILKLDPKAKIIIVSGYGADGTADRMLKEGARKFLDKPYEAMNLLQVAREVLDEE